MDRRIRVVGAVAALVVGTAVGTGVAPDPAGDGASSPGLNGSGEDPSGRDDRPTHTISIDLGRMDEQGDAVRISPVVSVDLYDVPDQPDHSDRVYEDVLVCMYDEDGTVVHGEVLGTIDPGPDGEFHEQYRTTVSVETIPTYVIVDHPDLRSGSHPFEIETPMVRDPDGELRVPQDAGLGEIQDDFEFPRSEDVGECG